MTKTCKKILLSVFLALCFVLCLGAFAACGGESNNNYTYTVTVKLEDDKPASNVRVKPKKGNAGYTAKRTGADGKVTFELPLDDYTVEITAPAHYSVPEDANLSLTKDSRDLSVTLSKNFTYTVSLVNPDNTPFYAENISIGMCTFDGNCQDAGTIGSDGVLIIDADPNNYHIKITGLPATATYDQDSEGYYTGASFSPTVTTMTIVIKPVSVVDFATPMTDEEKEEFAKNHRDYIKEYNSYKTVKEVPANGTAEISFSAGISGYYRVYCSGNTTLQFASSEMGGIIPQPWSCIADKTYTIKATNFSSSAATAEVVISVPFSSNVEQKGGMGSSNVNLTVGKKNTFAIVKYTPSKAGTYTATVQGTAVAVVKATMSEPTELIPSAEIPKDSDYAAQATDTIIISKNKVLNNHSIYFAVAVKADSYPTDVGIKIERTAESQDTESEATVTETLTQQTKPTGKKLYDIPMDGTSTGKLVYDETARVYRYGTGTNAPVVYVKLTTVLDANRFNGGNCRLAYMELISTANFVATYAFESEKNGVVDTVDYTVFLRGFKKYDLKPSEGGRDPILTIPTDIQTETYYAKFVNEDGAYPLTEELKVFLEKFYKANTHLINYNVTADANNVDAWLFPCCYYIDADNVPATDPIVGEYTKCIKYTDAAGTEINDSEYKLVINENGTFMICDATGNSQDEAGSWNKIGETYTFMQPNGLLQEGNYVDLRFTVTLEGGTITLTGVDTQIVWIFERA